MLTTPVVSSHLSPLKWTPNTNFPCLTQKVTLFNGALTVYSPDIAILAICGAMIGFLGCALTYNRRKALINSEVYAVIFFLFGCMNTCGLFINSIAVQGSDFSQNFIMFVGLGDGIFTSCVSLSFLYCGLADVGILKDKTWWTRAILLGSYLTLAFLWRSSFSGNFVNAFQYLYTDLTEIGSLSFFLLSFFWFWQNKTLRGGRWLLLAGISGVVGIFVLLRKLGDFCFWHINIPVIHLSIPLPSGGGVWYFFSDLALASFLLFYLTSKTIQKDNTQQSISEEKLKLLENC
eukprot:TRINITY_DN1055_c0_g1_i2.p1 TRINITY_DN1055_c0_g1~~TRINITY_DN1055_c0_g1_i2.p1  ORF type:complete len:290 (-),score=50.15 TRINITY_DN1055_c0_g1_i2:98-967(-)